MGDAKVERKSKRLKHLSCTKQTFSEEDGHIGHPAIHARQCVFASAVKKLKMLCHKNCHLLLRAIESDFFVSSASLDRVQNNEKDDFVAPLSSNFQWALVCQQLGAFFATSGGKSTSATLNSGRSRHWPKVEVQAWV